MGRDSRLLRERTCRECGESYREAAEDVADHARACKRLIELGLKAPSAGEVILANRPPV